MHISGWQVKRPLLACGLIAVAVTAIALNASLAVTLVCVVPLAVLLFWKRLWLCATVALCFLVVAVGYRHVYQRPAAGLDGEVDTIRGEVISDLSYGRMYLIRVSQSDYLPPGSRLMLHCPDDDLPLPGDRIEAEVRLYPSTQQQTYYTAQRAFVCAFPADEEGSLRTTHHTEQTDGLLQRFRTKLVGTLRVALPARESGLLSALCFGETDYVTQSDQAAFRGSGLSHLLVVSGLHLSMVALALRRLFRRFGMYPCCVMTLVATWLFALFVGATPSILRAATMLSLWLVGCMLFQHSDGLNALGLAAVILLAVNPYHLLNVGFQLSFAATLGVLLLAPRLTQPHQESADEKPWYQRLWQWIRATAWSGGVVCVSALLFSLPVAAYHYGGFPITTLLTNLLAGPAAGAAMLCGWLGALCGLLPFMGWLSNGLMLIAGLLIRYMGEVARIGSPAWAWLTVSQHWQWLLLVVSCALIAGALFWGIPRKRAVAAVTALAVLTAGVALPLTTAPVRLTVVSVDNEAGFVLQQGSHCALIVTQLRDINEVVYATAPFEPDVVVILDGDASAVTQADRWPTAIRVVATPNAWCTDTTAVEFPVGGSAKLWQGCRLTRLDEGWIQLCIGQETVYIGTDRRKPCPSSEGWHIYVGGVPASPPDTPYTVVCNNTWLRNNHPQLTGKETILLDETITFTPLRGEWRRMQWLWQ